MNDQFEPIDSELRGQLARRSAGRLPDGLLVDVTRALDAVPVSAAGLPRPRVVWRAPRLAAAGLCAAFVVVLVVALAFPALRGGPAAVPTGYPTNRALTVAELSSLLAGPSLATNAALVVSATIDIRFDVCPMNRYPTVGVIHGIEPQICVMQGGLPPQLTGTTATGMFALRYLGARTFGLLGEVTPASDSRITFGVTDDWPLAGKTFLVDGWLGADELPASCVATPAAGDVLSPAGDNCPYDDWLGDSPTAPGIADDYAMYAGSPRPSYDPLSLRGNARHVEAGGMRIIDGIDPSAPVHGVFVVRSITEGCAGASPADSRGCAAWRVLARLADLSLPASSAAPTPTPGPTGTDGPATPVGVTVAPTGLIGPGNKALTPDQLAALMAADRNHLAGRYVIDERITCDGTDCSGVPPKAVADTIGPDGAPELVSPVHVRPDGGIVWTYQQVLDALTTQGGVYIVDAWIGGSTCCEEPPVDPSASPKPNYEMSWLGYTDGGSGIGTAQAGAYHRYGGGPVGGGPPIHGLFLVDWMPGGKCGASYDPGTIDYCTPHIEILSRLETAVLPGAPTPFVLPTGVDGTAVPGLLGSGNRPLTEAEFAATWAADPAHLAGRVAIVKGPVPTGFECRPAGATGCNVAALDGQIAADGHYWAVRVGSDGRLAVVGEIDTPPGGFVFTLGQVNWAATEPANRVLMVDAWLDWENDCDVLPTRSGETCGYSLLTSEEVTWMHMRSLWPSDSKAVAQYVQPNDAYQRFGVQSFGKAVHGLYLVDATTATILARLAVATAP